MAGEVGLSGEVRPVNRIEQRIAEAEKLGFAHIIIPRYNMQGLNGRKFNIQVHPVRKVEEGNANYMDNTKSNLQLQKGDTITPLYKETSLKDGSISCARRASFSARPKDGSSKPS